MPQWLQKIKLNASLFSSPTFPASVNTLRTRQLIQAVARDDGEAFERFFHRFYPRLYRLAFYYVRSDVLSEEVVSDVFLKIWNNRKKLPEIAQLDVYFFRSVKNQALTYLKRESKLLSRGDGSTKSRCIEYNQPEKPVPSPRIGR